ncbi:MAG: Uncharacterised protein [Methanobacteriota archaeon]|jgi:hypothetical protein|nr:MAG: Uncharacterised protein [Euryarchaeota archaeon]|tara:strand:+ start:433 stop:873 length:441 start_codon:yes stop_codon:yes gene_type:complete
MNASEIVSMAETQAFYDKLANMDLSKKHNDWYQVDVAAVLDDCKLASHDIDPKSGDALLFLKNSLIFCSPELGVIRHYPRNLVHCFVEDKRSKPDPNSPELLYRAELFSITPESEQLCWVNDCVEAHKIPEAQSKISTWMQWLNNV